MQIINVHTLKFVRTAQSELCKSEHQMFGDQSSKFSVIKIVIEIFIVLPSSKKQDHLREAFKNVLAEFVR